MEVEVFVYFTVSATPYTNSSCHASVYRMVTAISIHGAEINIVIIIIYRLDSQAALMSTPVIILSDVNIHLDDITLSVIVDLQ